MKAMKGIYEKLMKRTILTLFIVFFAMIGFSTNYYIDPNGSNGNSGSIGNPWLTLSYACSHAIISGDIIHINAGTYIETAQSALAVGVSIEGTGVTSIVKSHFSSGALIILDSNASNKSGVNGNQYISNIKMDGDALTGKSAILVINRSNVKIHDCYFVDFSYCGVRFSGGYYSSTNYETGNEFYNNTVLNSSGFYPVGDKYGGASGGCLYLSYQSGTLVYNNNMQQPNRGAGANGDVIFANYIKGTKIYNNTLIKAPFDNVTWDFVLEFLQCKGGIEIYNNTISGDTDLNDIDKGTYDYGVYFHHNTVGNNTVGTYKERGLMIESTSDVNYACTDIIIRSNYFKNLTYGVVGNAHSGSVGINNLSVYYNVFNKTAGFEWLGGITAKISNVNIWNNTLYANGMAYDVAEDGIELPDVCTSSNISVKNNIIVGYYRSPIFAYKAVSGATINVVSIENNDMYGNGHSNTPYFTGIIPTNVTTQNNITSDPQFISSSDLHLKSTSLAIKKGINVGLTTDFENNPVYNLPNIGAYEGGNSNLDIEKPIVNGFIIPSTSTSLTIPISTFSATDNIGISGYLLTETSTLPSSGATGWSSSKPTIYTFTSIGSKTLYAWAKDAAGNVSVSFKANIEISNPIATIYTTEYKSICDGSNYNGWTQTGKYVRSFIAKSAADSIVTTYLTVNPKYNVTENITINAGESYNNWTVTGQYVRTLSSVSGCDSIVTTNLTVNSNSGKEGQIVPSHFIPVWQGQSGTNLMSFTITSATIEGIPLEINDEIAVFNGSLCVGAAKLVQSINSSDQNTYLVFQASQSTGLNNGYTLNDTIIFKIWDDSNLQETSVKRVNYQQVASSIISGRYTPLASVVADIETYTEYTQIITLKSGNNLISSNLIPDNPDISVVMKSLCDQGALYKMQDESGKSFEYWGKYGGWVNKIGNFSQTEGYNVNVKFDCSVQITGRKVELPLNIALNKGWNYISFPLTESVNGMNVIQSLIDQNKLVKVQDETGKSIENLKNYGWTNNIGDFLPGKGYKIYVSGNTSLTIQQSYPKSAAIYADNTRPTEFFTPQFDGNGVSHMNINIEGLKSSGLATGDEIAAFDGEICVGALKLTSTHFIDGIAGLVSSYSTNEQNQNGFIDGNNITIRVWKKANNEDLAITPDVIDGSLVYVKNGSVLIEINSIATVNNEIAEDVNIDVFPNPTVGNFTVRMSGFAFQNGRIEITDISGRVITSRQISNDSEKFNLENQVPGLYLVRAIIGTQQKVSKLVISK